MLSSGTTLIPLPSRGTLLRRVRDSQTILHATEVAFGESCRGSDSLPDAPHEPCGTEHGPLQMVLQISRRL